MTTQLIRERWQERTEGDAMSLTTGQQALLAYWIVAVMFAGFWLASNGLLGVPRPRRALGDRAAERWVRRQRSPLGPAGRQAARVTGALAALVTSLAITAPVIALARGGQALLVGTSATFLVGAVGLVLARVTGAPTPGKASAVGRVLATAAAFAVDAVVRSDATFLAAYAVAGSIVPLLSTLGDRTASSLMPHGGEYHGLRNQVAARLSAAFTCIPLLGLVGADRWVTALLAGLFGLQAVALLRWRMPQKGRHAQAQRRLIRGRGHARGVRGAAGVQAAAWRQSEFTVPLRLFAIGQLLGTAAGVMLATRLHESAVAVTLTFALVLSRLLAGGAFRRAGRLADRGLDARGVGRAGLMFLAAAVAFGATELVDGTPWGLLVVALTAFILLTIGLNALLVIARARVTNKVRAPTAIVDLGWVGTFAGFAGGALPPLVLPPGADGAGIYVLAGGIFATGVAVCGLAKQLARQDRNRPSA